jgi:ribose 5-phosphate isomerase B
VSDSIALGADDAGLALKDRLAAMLRDAHLEVADYGCAAGEEADYPDVALAVAEAVARGEHCRAILVCGTGIGMAIAANKVPGVRAAQAHDVYSAERARKSNNAQILTLGARVIGPESAKTVVHAWLASEFAGGASTRKVAKLEALDERRSAAGAS